MTEEQIREIKRLSSLLSVARIRAFAVAKGVANPRETLENTGLRVIKAKTELDRFLRSL